MSANNPTCPTGCDDFLLDVDFDFCDPQVSFGEIDKIFVMARSGGNLLDWESASEWATRLALDPTADLDAIIQIDVSGDQPPAEADEVIISRNRRVQTPKTFTVNFDVDDISDDNYQFMRWLECNTIVKIWYTANDKMFGSNAGIDNVTLMMDNQIERGQKTVHKLVGNAKWEAQYSPNRITNPLA